MVCYDAGFPEAARSLALSGAEIIFCPSAWRVEDTDMWDLNIAQRALENQLFTVGVNHGGMEGDLNLFGKSKICGPRGHVISECPAEKEVVQVVEIDLDEETAFRRDCAYLRDRNPRAYFKLTEA
jgi:predicted amidohydrolase